MRVLVVDDDYLVRRLMADSLDDAGYQVNEAENAAEAIATIEEGGEVELVVTDVRMPGHMDGFALSRWLKGRWPATGVLVVSGYADEDPSRERLYDAFLAKPFSARSLELAVSNVLRARQGESGGGDQAP